MCSWIARNRDTMDIDDDNHLMTNDAPTITDIQQTLVNINDKPPEFLHSTDWLGALEVCFNAFPLEIKNKQTNKQLKYMLFHECHCRFFM